MNNLYQKINDLIQQSVQEYIHNISNKYDLDEIELLAIWNNIELDGQKKKVVERKVEKKVEIPDDNCNDQPAEDDTNVQGCPYVFTKGTLSGKECGCKPKSNTIFCSKHKKHEESAPKTAKKVLPNPKKPSEPEPPQKVSPSTKKSIVPALPKKTSPPSKIISVVLRKNKTLDKLWHVESSMVFKSAQERVVIGKCVDDKLHDLTAEDIEVCKLMNFRYETNVEIETKVSHKIPIGKDASNMKKSINKAINNTNIQADDIEEILNKLQRKPEDSSDSELSDVDELSDIDDEDEEDEELFEEY